MVALLLIGSGALLSALAAALLKAWFYGFHGRTDFVRAGKFGVIASLLVHLYWYFTLIATLWLSDPLGIHEAWTMAMIFLGMGFLGTVLISAGLYRRLVLHGIPSGVDRFRPHALLAGLGIILNILIFNTIL